MRRAVCSLVVAGAIVAGLAAQPAHAPDAGLGREARLWVDRTLARMSLDEMAGQLLSVRLDSTFLSSDSDTYEALVRLVHDVHAGSVIAYGGVTPVPDVLLNPAYGSVILGQPLALASTLNRLQAVADVPLLVAADVEWGAGMRIAGATRFPRAMAFGAAGDAGLVEAAGRVTAVESRAMGIHVAFAPVADVNSNPRNPVINIRSFGEDPARVGALVAAAVRGLQAGGVLATLKHFPGHGDTAVDSHIGLPVIPGVRERLEAVELPPFAAGVRAGAAGVMAAHIGVPALDPSGVPATFSRPMLGGVLRGDIGFDGIVYSDSMRMEAIARMASPGEAAVRALAAGVDVVLDTPDPRAALAGITAAVAAGTLDRAIVEASARRVLEAKARLGLHRTRQVDLDAVPLHVGGRAHADVARQAAARAVTLIQDVRGDVPLRRGREASVLYLSVLDYPAEWGTGAPGRTLVPELKRRWPDTEAIELSDASTVNERALVAAMAPRFDAVVAGVFVRAASASGRLDLDPALVRLLQDMARESARRGQPFIAAFFGNPYVAMRVPDVPAMLLAFDLSDHAEAAVAAAIAGDAPIGGRLPIALPGLFPVGHGLTRPATPASGARR